MYKMRTTTSQLRHPSTIIYPVASVLLASLFAQLVLYTQILQMMLIVVGLLPTHMPFFLCILHGLYRKCWTGSELDARRDHRKTTWYISAYYISHKLPSECVDPPVHTETRSLVRMNQDSTLSLETFATDPVLPIQSDSTNDSLSLRNASDRA
jgi:hypothetical protein